MQNKLKGKGQVNSNTIVVHQRLFFSTSKQTAVFFYSEYISFRDEVTNVFKNVLLE